MNIRIKKYLVHIVWLVVAIIALGGGYLWGKTAGMGGGRAGFAGAGAFSSSTRRMASGTTSGGFVAGQITAIDQSSITLQLPNGSSEVVFYSSSTPVSEPTTVSVSVLEVGTKIAIGGTGNSDGSLTAQTIQVQTGNSAGGHDGGSGVPTNTGH